MVGTLPLGQARLALFLAAGVLNLPFGMYRVSTERFSLSWLLAIHAPVPIVVFLRKSRPFKGMTLRMALPFSLAGAFVGQYVGGKTRSDFNDDRSSLIEPHCLTVPTDDQQ